MKDVPKFIEVELDYSWCENPIVFVFLRRRKKDAELEDRERMLGDGKKLKPATKLARLVENIKGFPGLDPRGLEEAEEAYRTRVETFFTNEDGQEFAEDALLYKQAAVFPRLLFRGTENHSLEVNPVGQTAGRESILPLLEVPASGEGSSK
jgi:hypothetical protein